MSRPLVGMDEEASQLERLCLACRAAVLDDNVDDASRYPHVPCASMLQGSCSRPNSDCWPPRRCESQPHGLSHLASVSCAAAAAAVPRQNGPGTPTAQSRRRQAATSLTKPSWATTGATAGCRAAWGACRAAASAAPAAPRWPTSRSTARGQTAPARTASLQRSSTTPQRSSAAFCPALTSSTAICSCWASPMHRGTLDRPALAPCITRTTGSTAAGCRGSSPPA
jgi:hypothetical protein